MFRSVKTDEFDKAFRSIADGRARARIAIRVRRLEGGNPGDVKAVGAGINEMRISYGPGYRVYYSQIGQEIVLLLTCGDKSSQHTDIETAKALRATYRQEN